MTYEQQRRFYESLPLALKRLVRLVPFGIIAGQQYRSVVRRGPWFDRASRAELLNYQERELARVLRFAVDQVPAYRHLLPVVERHRPLEALKEFPLVDRDTLQADPKRFLPRDLREIPHYKTTTGGTTGRQMRIYLDNGSQAIELGFMHRQWKRVGYAPHHRKATFRGVSFPNVMKGAYWQHNPIYNELQFSPFHMSESHLPGYVAELRRFAPIYLHGYPSALDTLAEYIERQCLEDTMPPFKAALLASEGASAAQRDRIERAFRTRVYSWYGHSERVILAGECERNATYHHLPDYGLLEVVDECGNDTGKEGHRGEIVGTGFYNRSMPLIRYRTGDYATRLEPQCDCGRAWDRFSDVAGRWKQDMLIGRNGGRISLAAINMHGPLFERVKRFQYYQDVVGACIVNLVPAPGFDDRDRARIEAAYKAKLGDELTVRVEMVDDIPLTPRGKLKMLDSRLTARNGSTAGSS